MRVAILNQLPEGTMSVQPWGHEDRGGHTFKGLGIDKPTIIVEVINTSVHHARYEVSAELNEGHFWSNESASMTVKVRKGAKIILRFDALPKPGGGYPWELEVDAKADFTDPLGTYYYPIYFKVHLISLREIAA